MRQKQHKGKIKILHQILEEGDRFKEYIKLKVKNSAIVNREKKYSCMKSESRSTADRKTESE
jgi:hypothetical protein